MSIFIKSGYWKKEEKSPKGWLNLDVIFGKFLTSSNVVTSTDVNDIIVLTQTEYDALTEKGDTTMYVIVEPET